MCAHVIAGIEIQNIMFHSETEYIRKWFAGLANSVWEFPYPSKSREIVMFGHIRQKGREKSTIPTIKKEIPVNQ